MRRRARCLDRVRCCRGRTVAPSLSELPHGQRGEQGRGERPLSAPVFGRRLAPASDFTRYATSAIPQMSKVNSSPLGIQTSTRPLLLPGLFRRCFSTTTATGPGAPDLGTITGICFAHVGKCRDPGWRGPTRGPLDDLERKLACA